VTCTCIAARFPTCEAAEDALVWARRYSVKVPLAIQRHECAQSGHQAEPWLLVSSVAISEEPLPALMALESNGHR
jgi:hypothetical protein